MLRVISVATAVTVMLYLTPNFLFALRSICIKSTLASYTGIPTLWPISIICVPTMTPGEKKRALSSLFVVSHVKEDAHVLHPYTETMFGDTMGVPSFSSIARGIKESLELWSSVQVAVEVTIIHPLSSSVLISPPNHEIYSSC